MADVQQHPQQYFPGADANEATRPPIEPLPYSTQDYLDEIVRVKRSRRRWVKWSESLIMVNSLSKEKASPSGRKGTLE